MAQAQWLRGAWNLATELSKSQLNGSTWSQEGGWSQWQQVWEESKQRQDPPPQLWGALPTWPVSLRRTQG